MFPSSQKLWHEQVEADIFPSSPSTSKRDDTEQTGSSASGCDPGPTSSWSSANRPHQMWKTVKKGRRVRKLTADNFLFKLLIVLYLYQLCALSEADSPNDTTKSTGGCYNECEPETRFIKKVGCKPVGQPSQV
ncbi:uncharacterized protein MCYG_01769 [Microsporum canis CBS 113480]|uniref:Uncharacterized protein n=1 Tax=Arthroderma otae (strain ATCC MYA-4605 / CBS 113480) TaxID=554155 RepID=C5FHX0_ARTOC|nr:uncharacterized protein MCYG_01769 [Microsporum canis CBS 113480]EEQ28950.1 predicted protein [Microsporum canis CBS 113480]